MKVDLAFSWDVRNYVKVCLAFPGGREQVKVDLAFTSG